LESGAEQSHPEQCGWDAHWRTGFQTFGLGLASRIPRFRARSIFMKTGVIKQNFNFEKSQELKGQSEKFKYP
jgi:hypothetical protein